MNQKNTIDVKPFIRYEAVFDKSSILSPQAVKRKIRLLLRGGPADVYCFIMETEPEFFTMDNS